MSFPKMRIFGDLSHGTGYNNALVGLCQALRHLDYTPDSLHVIGAISDLSGEAGTPDWLHPYVYGPWEGDDRINLVHLNPGAVGQFHTSLDGRYNIAYCAWETSRLPRTEFTINGQPRTVVGDLNRFDEIWVPTAGVKLTFEDSGVKAPVFVIPHVLRDELVKAAERGKPEGEPGRKVQIYTMGAWNARKDVEGLLRAYLLTAGFNKATPVHLQMHCVPASRDQHTVEACSWMTQEAVKNVYGSLANQAEAPGFSVTTVPRPYTEVIRQHQHGDIFATMSRGEGFNLPAVEAAAMGNYVIGSHAACEPLSVLLEHDPSLGEHDRFISIDDSPVPITPMAECRGYELDQMWWQPNFGQMVKALQETAKRAETSGDGECEELARVVRTIYGTKRVAQLIATRLAHAQGVLEASGW